MKMILPNVCGHPPGDQKREKKKVEEGVPAHSARAGTSVLPCSQTRVLLVLFFRLRVDSHHRPPTLGPLILDCERLWVSSLQTCVEL